MNKLKKLLALILTAIMLVGTFTIAAAAEGETESETEQEAGTETNELCQNGQHTPDGEKYSANYTECSGGYKTDYYTCSVCGIPCDESGNGVMWESGAGKHTPNLEHKHDKDYTICGGGYQRDYYACIYCGTFCEADGSTVENLWKDGNDQHIPGELIHSHKECGRHFEDYYICSVCGKNCDAEGNRVELQLVEGNGQHTPGLYEPYYTECSGGYKDHYICSVCHEFCDAKGHSIQPQWVEGTGHHTPGCYLEGNFTECGGGVKEGGYICLVCEEWCNEKGEKIERSYIRGSGKHIPEYHSPINTECGGGFKDGWYTCGVCGTFCDADGNSVPVHFPERIEGTVPHTPGKFHLSEATLCGGGWEGDYYECAVCGKECDLEGNSITRQYVEGTGVHIPGEKRYEPDYMACTGGHVRPYYVCTVCGMACDKSGYRQQSYLNASAAHTPGTEPIPEDPLCIEGYRSEHYVCTKCGNACDANGSDVMKKAATSDHMLVTVPPKAATYEEEGNIEHLKCTLCGKLYMNKKAAERDEESSIEDVTLPKLVQNNPVQTVEVVKGIGQLPEQVAGKYASVAAVEAAMAEVAIRSSDKINSEKVKTELLDVTLKTQKDDGQWETVTPENFPEEGVTVLLPYPEGTSKDTHDFVVTHMITRGDRAGEIEMLYSVPEEGGIRVIFSSLSPVMIAYQKKADTPTIRPLPGSPETGDKGALCLWAALLLISGAAAAMLSRKRASK